MLSNNSNFYQAELTIGKQILFDTKNRKSVGVFVSDADYDADIFAASGRKIVKAGMPLAGDLEDRITVPFTVATGTAGSTITVEDTSATQQTITQAATTDAVGVLWHDVDVTNGPNNGTLLTTAHINRDRLEDSVNTFYDANEAIIEALALVGVKFFRDR